MDKLKICITTLEFPPDVGGVGESVKRISNMLVGLGHEVHVVVFHSKRRKEMSCDNNKKGFVTSRQDRLFVHHYQHVTRTESISVQDFMSDVYGELKRLHDQEFFDVFHSFYINETGFLTTLLAKEVGRPVINSIRGADLHRSVFIPQKFGHIQWALENSDWLTFVSRELEKRSHILAPTISERTTAFWNSIMPIDFNHIERPVPEHEFSGTVISTFGNMRDKKGIDHLIWACAELAREIDLTLLLVGDFIDKEKHYWGSFVRDSGIEDRIVVTGRLPREQALGYHHVSDIFAIPSLRDGCPNALLEAMLAGKAIVGSGVDAIGEILDHEENALVVHPGNTDDLVNALRRLATDSTLRQRLGQAARNKALQELSPACELENWVTIYNRVMSSGIPAVVNCKTISKI